MFMCRWMNGDVSFVSARTKEDAIVMLDEWDDAEGAEIIQIRDFMVDFRLNDEGDLELAEFAESCRDTILEKAYPRLREAITAANGELVTHAAIGVWYNPRQCRRHRYESKLINAEPLTGDSGGGPPRPACVRWPL